MLFVEGNTLIHKTGGVLQNVFHKLETKDVITGLYKFKHLYQTRIILEENLLHKRTSVNNSVFGYATVFKNFQAHPITIA